MKATRFDFDVAILGAGSAGYAAARTAASAGLKTVVIEGGAEVGGLCILRGCMPSKALLYAAEVRHLAQRSATWGLRPGKIGFDFQQVMARKAAMIEDFASYRRQQLERGKFKFIRATAKFVDAHTLALSRKRWLPAGEFQKQKNSNAPAGSQRSRETTHLTARHFIIATGSIIAPPPLPSLAEVGYLTSDDALSLPKLPKSLIVLGGGAIACELAQFFARFDVQVTQIQRSPHILRDFDDDAGRAVATAFRREGIQLYVGTKLLHTGRSGKQKFIEFEHGGKRRRVRAEEILFALGRCPNTAGLGLEHAGVQTEAGRISVWPETRVFERGQRVSGGRRTNSS